MKKKVYLIHGWGGSSKDNWLPWMKKELEKKNMEVKSFDLPDSEHPRMEIWIKYLEEKIKEVDEHTYFIGHSIGCQTIMRFLEKLHKHKRIGGCIFVAGFFEIINLEPEELRTAQPWMTNHIDTQRVLDHCDKFLAFFSDNDPYVHLDESEKFKEKLGAEIKIERNKGHFDDPIQKEVLRESLKFIK